MHLAEMFDAWQAQKVAQCRMIDNALANRRLPNFMETAHVPIGWVRDPPGAYHVEIDVHDAPMQMAVGLHRSRMVTIFPKCATTLLSSVVILPCPTRDKLHGGRNFILAAIQN